MVLEMSSLGCGLNLVLSEMMESNEEALPYLQLALVG